jgi:hypothetical protein
MKRSYPFSGFFTLGIIGLMAIPPVQAGPKKVGTEPQKKPSKVASKRPPKAEQAARQARLQIQALKVLDGFDQRYGSEFEIVRKKAAWLKRLERELSFVPACEAYVEGDVCMIAGWQGLYQNGRCRINEERGIEANDVISVAFSCSNSNSIACNPDIFGLVVSPVLEPLGDAHRDAPLCVPRTERRMTMACLRESLVASGVAIQEPARSNLSQFNPESLSDDDLSRWFWHLNSEVGAEAAFTPSSQTAIRAAQALCGHLRSGTRRTGTGDFAARTEAEMRVTMRSDASRGRDLRDCEVVERLAQRIQPEGSTPAVTDVNPVAPETTMEGIVRSSPHNQPVGPVLLEARPERSGNPNPAEEAR